MFMQSDKGGQSMFVRKSSRPRTAMLGDGTVLTLADLPSGTERWVARRKAVVVQAIGHGLLTRDEAMDRYGLTEEELESWITTAARMGPAGLKVKAIREIRQNVSCERFPDSPLTRF